MSEEQSRFTRMARRSGEPGSSTGPPQATPWLAQRGLSEAGYNVHGEPLWINAKIALAQLGFNNPPDYIGISRSNQILEKAWRGMHSGVWHWPYPGEVIPTWEALVEAERLAILDLQKSVTLEFLRYNAAHRITRDAYDAHDRDDERDIRLRGDQTPAQDTERDRLRTKYREIRDMLNAQATEEELFAINLKDDKLWA